MKIGDRVCVKGYVDEIRKDTVIIRNEGGYFGTVPSEVFQPVKDYGSGYRAGQIDAIENVLVAIREEQEGYETPYGALQNVYNKVIAMRDGEWE